MNSIAGIPSGFLVVNFGTVVVCNASGICSFGVTVGAEDSKELRGGETTWVGASGIVLLASVTGTDCLSEISVSSKELMSHCNSMVV